MKHRLSVEKDSSACVSDTAAQPTFSLSSWRFWLLMMWGFVVSTLWTGYEGFRHHHFAHILIQRFHQPDLYPNDPFVDTVYSFASVYWYLVALVSNFVPVETLLGGLFLATRLIVLYAVYRLARVMFPTSMQAWFLSLMVIVTTPMSPVGGSNPIKPYADQTMLAFGCVLLSLGSFVSRQWIFSAALLGLSASMNLMYALYGLVYIVATFVLDAEARSAWRAILKAAPIGLLLGLPGILLVAREAIHSLVDPETVWKTAELVYAEQFFMEANPIWMHGVTLVLFSAGLWITYFWKNLAKQASLLIRASTVAGLIWYCLAWLAPEINSLPLLQLHPIRGCDFWIVVLALFWTGLAAQWLNNQNWARLNNYLLSGFVVWGVVVWNVLLPATLRRLTSGGLMLILLIVGCLIWYWLTQRYESQQRRSKLRLVGLYGLTAIFLSGMTVGRYVLEHRPVRLSNQGTVGTVAEWVQQNTAPEAVFLVPLVAMASGDSVSTWSKSPEPAWNLFRQFSQRNVFVLWLDGGSWMYARWYPTVWLERLQGVGFFEVNQLQNYRRGQWILPYRLNMERFKKTYHRLDDERVLLLQQRYRIDYWIVPASKQSRFPVVYQHEGWKVLKVGSK